jgi:hypothetical protein
MDYLTLDEEALSCAWVRAAVKVVDPRWVEIEPPLRGLVAWQNRPEGLQVFCSSTARVDGRRWLHFSVCGRQFLPSWEQLVRAKEAILGLETKAIQVIAPRSEWVNINPRVLHLWVCLDGDVLPDFTEGTGSL